MGGGETVNILNLIASNKKKKIAVSDGSQRYDYETLLTDVHKVARWIYPKVIKEEKRIVCVPTVLRRSYKRVVILLALHQCGVVNVPLSYNCPKERIVNISTDCNAPFVITEDSKANGYSSLSLKTIWEGSRMVKQWRKDSFRSQPIFTLLYTSGTTGKPKGVKILQNGIIRISKDHYYGGKNGDKWLANNNPAFDASLLDTIVPLIRGQEIVIFPDTDVSISELAHMVKDNGITMLFTTTSLFNILVDEFLPFFSNLRCWIFGGEKASTKHVLNAISGLPDSVQIINGYGPTETTMCAITSELRSIRDLVSRTGVVPIGMPIYDTEIHLLDDNLKPVEPGEKGELYIGGGGVSDGYWNREKLTKERFIEDPFHLGRRIYKTGDIALFSVQDQQFYFVGRKDNQVKIQGVRIEPEEIEQTLLEHPDVAQAVVLTHQHPSGEHYICGYVVPKAKETFPSSVELKQFMENKLVKQMIPSYFIVLEKMPLNSNHKADRSQLLPPVNKLNAGKISNSGRYPQTLISQKLAKLWAELLNMGQSDRLSLDDNFFYLGGNSLLVNKMACQLKRDFGVELPITKLFKDCVQLESLSKTLAQSISKKEDSNLLSLVKSKSPGANVVSSGQKRMWISFQSNPTGVEYNLPLIYDINGTLNVNHLARAIQMISKRHPILNTVITINSNHQIVQQQSTEKVPLSQVLCKPSEADALTQEEIIKPFDISNEPPIRVKLLNFNNSKCRLIIILHHIAFDGSSISPFTKELEKCYQACLDGKSLASDPGLQYIDYAYWEQESLRLNKFNQQAQYWKDKLQPPHQHLELATDYLESSLVERSDRGEQIRFVLSDALSQRLEALATFQGCTKFVLILLAWKLLMHKYSQQEEITVGTFFANRKHSNIQDTIGFFINTLAIRSRFQSEENPQLSTVLKTLNQSVLEAIDNSDIPFDQVVNLVSSRGSQESPLFRTAVAFQNMEIQQSLKFGQHKATLKDPDQFHPGSTKFDLQLNVYDQPKRSLWGSIEYRTDLWKKETIQRMHSHFLNLLQQLPDLIENNLHLSDVEILSAGEKADILGKPFDMNIPYAEFGCVHRRFEEIVNKFPQNIAIQFENTTLTYRELNEKANQFGYYLGQKGIKTGELVAIYLPRTEKLIIAILAVLKIGAAYVPIDPIYPVNRILYMLKDTKAPLMISAASLLGTLQQNPEFPAINILDTENAQTLAQISSCNNQNLTDFANAEDMIYVMYTSGSTGNPKGVILRHFNVIRLMDLLNVWFKWSPQDVWVLFHSYAFDVSINEIFGALFFGGKLWVVSNELRKNTIEFHKFLEDGKVTCLCQTPSAFHVLTIVDEEVAMKEKRGTLTSLRTVSLAGEMLHFQTLKSFVKRHGDQKPLIINLYGSTETTVHSTYRPIRWKDIEENSGSYIGVPIPDQKFYVLDSYFKPVPIGVIGELYMGGYSVSKGYLNLPEITAKKFVKLPHLSEKGIFYRSGDLVKYLPNKEMVYIGRRDNQVKIRGFRIDLNDITSAVINSQLVTKAHTTVRQVDKTQNSNDQIVTYIVAPSLGSETLDSIICVDKRSNQVKNQINITTLVNYLKQLLPHYMIPSIFVLIDDFFLNANGKLDASVLPKDFFAMSTAMANSNRTLTDTEKSLLKVCQQVLQNTSIGIEDNFFSIGGNSLLATTLVLKIKNQLNINLPVSYIFSYPILRNLASALDKMDSARSPTTLNVEQETELSEFTVPPNFPRQKNSVLLTGATGFVGCFFLFELLKRTNYIVYCIVNGKNAQHASQRLKEVIASYELDISTIKDFNQRVCVLNGDLTKPFFGLHTHAYDNLAADVFAIYHIAAKVSFVEPYKVLRAANVEATKQLVRFAALKFKKEFHYFSSLSVLFTMRAICGIESVKEDIDISILENKLFMGYTETKLVCEKILMNAKEKGLAITIFRIAGVVGHSKTGATNRSDIFARKLSSMLYTGCYPDTGEVDELITVDDACSVILSLSLNPKSIGKAFHVTAERALEKKLILGVAEFCKTQLKGVTVEEWKTAIINQGESNKFYPLLPLLTDKYSEKQMTLWDIYSMPPTFAKDNIKEILPNFKFTPITQDIISRCVIYLSKHIQLQPETLTQPIIHS